MSTLSEALAPRSDQLNADDLIPGPRTLKITGGRIAKDGRQTRIILNYAGDEGKPFKPCKTMGRAMVMVWALTDEGFQEQVKGKSIRVYRDPEVTFGDQGQVGGIRISHMSHIDKPANVKLTVSQGKKALFTFHPLVTEQAPAEYTIDAARADIAAADSLDALRKRWLGKSMAPFRDELSDTMLARKAELAFDAEQQGPSDDQRGESHTITADELVEHIGKRTREQDVIELVASWTDAIAEMSEDDRARIMDAQTAKIAAIKGGR